MGTALAAALRAPAESRPARPRRATARAPTSCCCACPTPRSRPPPPRRRPGRLVGHCSGATTLAPLAPARGVLAAPADDGPGRSAGPVDFAGARAAIAGSTPRALDAARELADALGMTAVDDRRRRPRRLPRGRLDRLQLPRHAARRSRAPARHHRRRRPRGCSSRSCAPTVENWARAGDARADGPDRPRRRARPSPRQRAAVAERAPELLELFDALADATAAVAGRRCLGMKIVRTVNELRAALAPHRAARALDRRWCRRWATCTTATLA